LERAGAGGTEDRIRAEILGRYFSREEVEELEDIIDRYRGRGI
jgi:hypothetical protein